LGKHLARANRPAAKRYELTQRPSHGPRLNLSPLVLPPASNMAPSSIAADEWADRVRTKTIRRVAYFIRGVHAGRRAMCGASQMRMSGHSTPLCAGGRTTGSHSF
jgi:hypothetical protein